jgi:uncharacterized RDD family membrane protein YckC
MTCSYCGGRHYEEDTRCRRCGRKPGDTLTAEVKMHRTDGALAEQEQPAIEMHRGPVGVPGSRRASKLGQPVQGSLFWERPAAKVIAFESFQTAPYGTTSRPRSAAKTGSKTSRPNSRRASFVHEMQGTLDFLPPAPPKPRTLGTTVEAVIYCEDPVASRLHRAVAAGLDWSMVLLAYGLYLLVYRFCGGELLLDKSSLLLIGGVLPLLGCLYGFTWAIAGNETPGMRWAKLRLTTFDGFRPERSQRLLRFAGSCLSLCTLVGLLWSFADEESLAWPDHISGTFPTPRRMDSQTLLRM